MLKIIKTELKLRNNRQRDVYSNGTTSLVHPSPWGTQACWCNLRDFQKHKANLTSGMKIPQCQYRRRNSPLPRAHQMLFPRQWDIISPIMACCLSTPHLIYENRISGFKMTGPDWKCTLLQCNIYFNIFMVVYSCE